MIIEEFPHLLGFGKYSGLFEKRDCKSLKNLALQSQMRKLVQGSMPHASYITGYISLNPELQQKQNC